MDEETYASLLCRMIAASDQAKAGLAAKRIDKAAMQELSRVAVEATKAGVNQRIADDYAKYVGLPRAS